MIKTIYSFFTNIDEYHLYNYTGFEKNLLIYSNIIYIILFLLFINLKNIKNNNYIYILIIIFLISTYYHYNQCHSNDITKFKNCYKIDLIMCICISIIIYHNIKIKLNSKIIILFLISLILFCVVFTIKAYIYCHSLWHITSD